MGLRLVGSPIHGNPSFNSFPPEGTSMEKMTMKALIAVIIGASFLIGGCNTVEGVGKDVKAAGDKVQDEAAEHRK
jgi:predicted small secreted protein